MPTYKKGYISVMPKQQIVNIISELFSFFFEVRYYSFITTTQKTLQDNLRQNYIQKNTKLKKKTILKILKLSF